MDVFNTRVIDYMERHDSFSLLETKVMDRVIRQMWEGSIDTGGSFFGLSTCFNIIRKAHPGYQKDYERSHRLKCRRDLGRKRHHQLTFRAYLKSMNLRYYLDMLTFVVLMSAYIYLVLKWKVVRQRNRDFRPELISY